VTRTSLAILTIPYLGEYFRAGKHCHEHEEYLRFEYPYNSQVVIISESTYSRYTWAIW